MPFKDPIKAREAKQRWARDNYRANPEKMRKYHRDYIAAYRKAAREKPRAEAIKQVVDRVHREVLMAHLRAKPTIPRFPLKMAEKKGVIGKLCPGGF